METTLAVTEHRASTTSQTLPQVLAATAAVWDWHGVPCKVASEESADGGAVVGAVGLPALRRVEVVVDEEVSTSADATWEALRNWPLPDSWRLCAVVPLAAMGHAHEVLREVSCELQPWWRQPDGSIAFGGVEIA